MFGQPGSTCRGCGLPIRFATLQGTGERVKLENLPSGRGEDRFREVSYNPLTVQPVPPNEDRPAYKRHICREWADD